MFLRILKVTGIVYDAHSNALYVADSGSCYILKILLDHKGRKATSSMFIVSGSLDANGYKDGSGEEALHCCPTDIALDAVNRRLYVTDYGSGLIRMISLREPYITTTLCGYCELMTCEDADGKSFLCLTGNDEEEFEGGYEMETPATGPRFYHPTGLAFDSIGNCLYVADQHRIIKKIQLPEDDHSKVRGSDLLIVEIDASVVSTLSPIGEEEWDPRKDCLGGLVLDPHSKGLYVMDTASHRIKHVVDFSRVTKKQESEIRPVKKYKK